MSCNVLYLCVLHDALLRFEYFRFVRCFLMPENMYGYGFCYIRLRIWFDTEVNFFVYGYGDAHYSI